MSMSAIIDDKYIDWRNSVVVGKADRAMEEAGGLNDHAGFWGEPIEELAKRDFYGMYQEFLNYMFEDASGPYACYLLYYTLSNDCGFTMGVERPFKYYFDKVSDSKDLLGDFIRYLATDLITTHECFLHPLWENMYTSPNQLLMEICKNPMTHYHLLAPALSEHQKYIESSMCFRLDRQGCIEVMDKPESYTCYMRDNHSWASGHIDNYQFITEAGARAIHKVDPSACIYRDVFESGLHVWARTAGCDLRDDETLKQAYRTLSR